jgi:hypothetical protein
MGATITVRDAAQGAAAQPGWSQASCRNAAVRPQRYLPEGLLRGGGVCFVARLARTPVRVAAHASHPPPPRGNALHEMYVNTP